MNWARLGWTILPIVYGIIAFTLSVVQPLGAVPDEVAHVRYIRFLAEERRLPLYVPRGGGEAGHQAQQPPLYYTVMALVYCAAAGLQERWRWQILRWATILLVGYPLLAVSALMMRRLWPRDPTLALASTPTLMLMPLTILYTGHVNPDGLALLLVTAAVFLSIETAVGKPAWGRAAVLGAVLGGACLTKMSAFAALLLAGYGYLVAARRMGARAWAAPVALTAGGCVAVAAWWYARNLWFYGTPFIHTTPLPGSALENALRPGGSFSFYAWLGIRETYLSTWAQRGWFPAGIAEWVLYGVIVAYTLGAVGGWLRRPAPSADEASGADSRQEVAARMLALLLGAIVVAQQSAYWFADVGWNAGGRYVMVAMSSVAFLGVAGLCRLLPRRALCVALSLWLISLVAMNLLSAWNIVTVLNPRYFPGWQIFHLPPG